MMEKNKILVENNLMLKKIVKELTDMENEAERIIINAQKKLKK